MNDRVICLYRVSTTKQLSYDGEHEPDIPMQKRECRNFAQKQGWSIVKEYQEDGVSGYKVRAENRDAIQQIKEDALHGRFDIFLVFMYDRVGRIADETPFVVEWLVEHGIRVWSVEEGEQRFDNHTDRLMNYIRYWQADGESRKTSIRTKTALKQIVEDGGFKGGIAPYGYDLVKSGRYNKHKSELYQLKVNEAEAAVVRIIFEKYAYEGYGPQRIATYLNDHGYRNKSGKCWHPATIRGMIRNLTYTGILRCGEARSELQPHLQIISQELYSAALAVTVARSSKTSETPSIPRNTRGKSLLVSNIYCGHCGARMILTTNTKKSSSGKEIVRIRYICYGKTRKQTECDGQTGYLQYKVDDAVEQIVRGIFAQMEGVSEHEVIEAQYQIRMKEKKALLQAAEGEYAVARKELDSLEGEVILAIQGNSAFTKEVLSEMLPKYRNKCVELGRRVEKAKSEYEHGHAVMQQMEQRYNEIISMAEMYDKVSLEAKKMIIGKMIDRVDLYRGYRLNIQFRPEFKQFFNLDCGLDHEGLSG